MKFTLKVRTGFRFLSGLAVLFGILFWTGCAASLEEPDHYKLTYPEHVWLARDLSTAVAGDDIRVFVNPPPGKKLKSLRVNGGTPLVPPNPYDFKMPARDVVIDAELADLAQDEFSVTLGKFSGGRAYVNPTYGKSGEPIELVLMPDLLYQYDSFTEPPQGLEQKDVKTFTFPLPSKNTTLEVKFKPVDPPSAQAF
jgi:hypothetical protein